MPVKNLKGQKFGQLTVLERMNNNKFGDAQWLCQCDCGKTKVILGKHLRTGKTKSCGCLLSSQSKERMVKLLTTHGKSNLRINKTYRSMKDRCFNPNCTSYKDYGGRGITVCEEWRNDFMNFYDWAMENGYRDDLTIERIDVNGNYEPSNCTWITKSEQAKNTRRTKNNKYKEEL